LLAVDSGNGSGTAYVAGGRQEVYPIRMEWEKGRVRYGDTGPMVNQMSIVPRRYGGEVLGGGNGHKE